MKTRTIYTARFTVCGTAKPTESTRWEGCATIVISNGSLNPTGPRLNAVQSGSVKAVQLSDCSLLDLIAGCRVGAGKMLGHINLNG